MIFLSIVLVFTPCVNETTDVFEGKKGGFSNSTITQVVPTGTIFFKEQTTIDPTENQIPINLTYYDGIITLTVMPLLPAVFKSKTPTE